MRTATKYLLVLIALAALAAGVWRWVQTESPALAEFVDQAPARVRKAIEAMPPFEPAPSREQAEAPPAIEHPVEADPYSTLPQLDASDEELVGALATIVGETSLTRHVETKGLIRRLVVAIDNLPGGRLTMKQRPLKAVAGAPIVSDDGATVVLGDGNYARYLPLVELAERIDPAALVTLYRRYYPLFQQAYQDLGFLDGYFNDRLIAVIDHLLAAQPVTDPIRLVQPNVLYQYADPALEARSPGHKILLRIGPDNMARVQTVLRRWREVLLAP